MAGLTTAPRRLTDAQFRAVFGNARSTFDHLLNATQMTGARLAAIDAVLSAGDSRVSAAGVSDEALLASVQDISQSIEAINRAAELTDRQLAAVRAELSARVAEGASDRVEWSDPRVAFIAGEQLKAGSPLNPWPEYDRIQAEHGLALFEKHGAETDTYYDYPLVQYIAHARNGNPRHLEAFRTVVDAWTQKRMPLGTGTTPRGLSAGGIVLRAIELEKEDPARAAEVWAWLTKWATHHDMVWISRHYEREEEWYGVRDGAFTLLTMAQLATVHPSEAVRADMRERVRKACHEYFLDLQDPDGGWYWTASGANAPDRPFSQPFNGRATSIASGSSSATAHKSKSPALWPCARDGASSSRQFLQLTPRGCFAPGIPPFPRDHRSRGCPQRCRSPRLEGAA